MTGEKNSAVKYVTGGSAGLDGDSTETGKSISSTGITAFTIPTGVRA